jgi:integrase
MVELLSDGPLGVRDRALLLLGFAGAFRRSELVALDVADVSFTADGLIVRLPRSKTNQEGQGATQGIPYGSNPALRFLLMGVAISTPGEPTSPQTSFSPRLTRTRCLPIVLRPLLRYTRTSIRPFRLACSSPSTRRPW